jgi:hypothetical protein
MEHNMQRRLTVLLPARLTADLERAASASEVTLSEFTRAALRDRLQVDQPGLDQRGKQP